MLKHSKAPWTAKKVHGGFEVCQNPSGRVIVSHLDRFQDAALITMSPELLKAVEASYEQESCVCEGAELEPGSCHACYLESVLNKVETLEQQLKIGGE